jgi:hypothetical protein
VLSKRSGDYWSVAKGKCHVAILRDGATTVSCTCLGDLGWTIVQARANGQASYVVAAGAAIAVAWFPTTTSRVASDGGDDGVRVFCVVCRTVG